MSEMGEEGEKEKGFGSPARRLAPTDKPTSRQSRNRPLPMEAVESEWGRCQGSSGEAGGAHEALQRHGFAGRERKRPLRSPHGLESRPTFFK